MDADLIAELQNCLAKYSRTMALPPDQRAPFAIGIAKLEARIEQLRAATGMDTDQFVSRVQAALCPLHYVLSDDEQARLEECMNRAGACFRGGDQRGAMAALAGLDAYISQLMQTIKQEVLPV